MKRKLEGNFVILGVLTAKKQQAFPSFVCAIDGEVQIITIESSKVYVERF